MSRKRGKRWIPASWLWNRCRRCNQIIPKDRLFCVSCRDALVARGQGFW